MDRLFRIDFYPQEWLVATAGLAPDERGIYIQIVMMIYSNRGPIPFDEKHLASICGCSKRLLNSVIQRLVDKNFLQVSGTKIGQKRAEYELNEKRKHLERSSNGGRTTSENRRRLNKNSDLESTNHENPVCTPPPPPTAKENKPPTPLTENVPRETGVLKSSISGSGVGVYRVDHHLTDRGIETARRNAPKWDMQVLYAAYDHGINSGQREPPTSADAAFPEWVKLYTKGKPPS